MSSSTTADTVLVGAQVHTLDPGRPTATAVVIKDGMIAAVGDEGDVREWRGAATQIIDLDGATLTPGLVDGHIHPVLGLDLVSGIDLSDCTDLGELRDRLATETRRLGRGEWVRGFGLDHNVFAGGPITRTLIDDVLQGAPAFLRLYDGHSALVSGAALQAAGIDGPRRFAQRSTVVCDDRGRPTGHLLEHAAMDLVLHVMPPADPAERRSRLLALLGEMAEAGLTGGHVMDAEGGALELLADMETTADLPMRLRLAPWCMPGATSEELDRLVREHGRGGRRWSLGAVKFFIDGTVEGGTAWLEHPDCHGGGTDSLWLDPDAYTRAVRHLAAAGVQTATHAIGDAGVRHVLDTLEGIDTLGVRHRVEHIETLPREEFARFAALGVAASMQPTHSAYTKADHTDEWSRRLGPDRADRAWSCRDAHDSGAALVLGSDWPIAHFDPREVLATARLRRLPSRPDAAPVAPEQALTARTALEGMTSQAALVAGESHLAGRIAPGYRADLTAFGVDPIAAPADELASAPIRLTMVAGTVTHHG
ncbi:amidohydrolase [Kitasatospora saccharophila]|uniref:Amidohydrolase n=1 Tax=Kitasatospora saccharophila TaxID=407973 RepID=A0ABN2Y415_9ACTN